MKDCDVALCPGKDSCVLRPYFQQRRTRTLLERAELASAVDAFDNCANIDDLKSQYPRRLAASRKAQEQLRNQGHP